MTADAISERWSDVIDGLKERRYTTAAALLAEVKQIDCEPLSDGVHRVRLVFRYQVLADKFGRSGHSDRLNEVLGLMFGMRFEIDSVVDDETAARLAEIHRATLTPRQPEVKAGSEWQKVLRFTDSDRPARIVCPNFHNWEQVVMRRTTVDEAGVSIGLRCNRCSSAFRLVVAKRQEGLYLGAEPDMET